MPLMIDTILIDTLNLRIDVSCKVSKRGVIYDMDAQKKRYLFSDYKVKNGPMNKHS